MVMLKVAEETSQTYDYHLKYNYFCIQLIIFEFICHSFVTPTSTYEIRI